MSTFEDDRYQWRETYFILFDPSNRPLLESLRKELEPMFHSLKIRSFQTDEQGRLEMLSVASFEDSAALDIIFQSGEHVVLEMDALAKELARLTTTQQTLEKIEKAKLCTARLDVLHFEQMLPVDSDFFHEPTPSLFSEDEFLATCNESESENEPNRKWSRNSKSAEKTGKSPFSRRPRFQFDPEKYIEPQQTPQFEFEDSDDIQGDYEEETQDDRLDPNTLILVLETLCRLTDGVAIDPASGTVF